MENQSKIKCPNCGYEMDVQNVLSHQLEENIKRDFAARYQQEKDKINAQLLEIERDKAAFEEKKRKENELFQQKLELKLNEEKKQIWAVAAKKIQSEQAEQFASLQKELNEKSEKVKELHKTQAELARIQREKEEMAAEIRAKAEQELNAVLKQEKEKIRKQEQELNEMRFKELQKKLDDQIELTEEMSRKQKQGSMQLQGEVQELAIEEWLRFKFPLDTVEEIKKGVRGGDCIQMVHTHTRQNCGTIYYESKRTKEFQPGWIEKFKNDIRDRGADVGVLVTESLPSGMERMGLKEGIWICTFDEFKGLSFVIREYIVKISEAVATQENKGEKMSMLYDYLTSTEFRLQIEGIVEGFTQLKADLEAEKRSITALWKKREKQIDKVLINTNYMHSSLRGIAGNAIAPIRQLELPQPEETMEV